MTDQYQDAAVLVDAENVPPWALESIDRHVRKRQGLQPFVRRVYAEWTRSQAKPWGHAARALGYEQVQQIRYAQGKDVVDMRMALDALDLCRDFAERHPDDRLTFVLVSSDSDFIPLVHRLQRDRHRVVVYGEEKAMVMLRAAADNFVDVATVVDDYAVHSAGGHTKNGESVTEAEADLATFLLQAFKAADRDQTGRINLAYFGAVIKELDPDFDVKRHGAKKLVDLVSRHVEQFVVEPKGEETPPQYEVRLRRSSGIY